MSDETDETPDMEGDTPAPKDGKEAKVALAKALWQAQDDLPEDREARKAQWRETRGTYKTSAHKVLKNLEKQGFRLVAD